MQGLFDAYDYCDSLLYSDLHDLLKYFKHGYSKVTDHVCREIRFNRISRNQGKKIINFYSQRQPQNIHIFCKWLGIDEKALQLILNNHRNKLYWKEVTQNKWIKKEKIIIPKNRPKTLKYPNTATSKALSENTYITIGKRCKLAKRCL